MGVLDREESKETKLMWLLTIISLVGNVLNSFRVKWCFAIWILCNITWLIIDANKGIYSRMTLDAVQTVFCFIGFHEWSKHGN